MSINDLTFKKYTLYIVYSGNVIPINFRLSMYHKNIYEKNVKRLSTLGGWGWGKKGHASLLSTIILKFVLFHLILSFNA